MLKTKQVSFLFFVVLLLQHTQTRCPERQIEKINSEGKTECQACPNHCESCFFDKQDKLTCVYCNEGYYLTKTKKCKPCVKNCSKCSGSKLKQCSYLKQGYFLNSKQKIMECPENCSRCNEEGKCYGCMDGNYVKTIKETESKEQISMHMREVECKPCAIPNCEFCDHKEDQVNNSSYLSCRFCKRGYSIVSGQCQKCPENCVYCKEETLECTYCNPDYFLNKNNEKCEEITVENCQRMDGHGGCLRCLYNYYLEENTCKACKDKESSCRACEIKDDGFTCHSCDSGHYLTQQGKCEKCQENCEYCDEKGCKYCGEGFFVNADTKACEKCSLKNCLRCKTSNLCQYCDDGYFFNKETKECEKCMKNCLTCYESKDNCMRCPITHYTLHETIKTRTDKTGTSNASCVPLYPELAHEQIEIKVINRCVKKCPKQHKNKQVVINDAQRVCMVSVDHHANHLHAQNSKSSTNILDTMTKLKLQYQSAIARIRAESKEHPHKTGTDSCNYHGKLMKRERGNYDSYFFCRCETGYTGDNCELTETMLKTFHLHIIETLNNIETHTVKGDTQSRQQFLDALLMANKFKSDLTIIQKCLGLIHHYLNYDKEIENTKKLYTVYDALLLNLFDLIEDLKKTNLAEYEAEHDIKAKNDEIYRTIYSVVQHIENSLEDLRFSHSFLERDMTYFITGDSNSYVLAEYRIEEYKADKGFFTINPSINLSGYSGFAGNTVFLKYRETGPEKTEDANLQLINFAAALFEGKADFFNDVFVSNLIYFHTLYQSKPHKKVNLDVFGVKAVRIKFSLLFVPSYDNVKRHLFCKAYCFDMNEAVSGELERFIEAGDDDEENETAFVICKFHTHIPFKSYYFGVSIKKR